MTRTIPNSDEDWKDAADNTYSYFNDTNRGNGTKQMLTVIDELAIKGSVSKEILLEKFRPSGMSRPQFMGRAPFRPRAVGIGRQAHRRSMRSIQNLRTLGRRSGA
jgi:hypothetical protein